MSVLNKFVGLFGFSAPDETVVEFIPSSNPVIAHSDQLFSAEFERDGSDLVLSNFGQPDIRISDYFHGDRSADIHTADGKILAGDVVEKLAGPEFPAQYAQAGTATSTGAIGQVESISGTVTVQRASGVRENLSSGAKVFANDVVQTGAGGALSLTFVDGTIFTLAESSRMVLDSLIYDPASTANSGIFNLVEGSFVFIAGEVAKTGGMEVKTPAATMGIRGTTVLVRISAINGDVQVEVSLNQDPDGALGQFTITALDGTVIADVDSTETKWLISPVEGQTREVPRTAEELADDRVFLNQAFSAFRIANQRVDDGGEFVETDAGGPQPQQVPEDDLNAPQDAPPVEPGDDAPETDPEDDDRRGDLGSGIETELANDRTQPDTIDDGVVITTLVTGGDITPVAPFVPTVEPVAPVEDDADVVVPETPPVDPINTTPEIFQPTQTTEVLEDGSVILQGFNITDPQDDILTARLSVGSTLTLSTGSGVTILQGTGIDEAFTVIRGTGAQISDALNGAIYRPTPDADVSGTLTLEVSDGQLSATDVMVIDIIPVQDAPVAQSDVLQAGQNANGITGNLLANDFDVDTNPAADQLTVLSVTIDGTTHDLNGGSISVTLAGGASFTIRPDGSYLFDTNNAYGALGEGQTDNETIEYTLSDGHEGDHGQSVTGQVNVEITGVNDAPVLSGDGQISVNEGQVVTLTQADLHAQDVDNAAPELVYTLTSVPANGQLELAGASGTPITSFTQQQIDNGEVVYVHNGSTGTDDTFSFTVTDGLATVSGDVDVAITQINDDPSGTGLPISLTITEDTAAALDLSSLQLSDPDAADSSVTLTLEADNADISAHSTSSVTVTTTATGLIIAGSIADLNAALSDTAFITLTPDEDLSGTGAATVSVSINDNGNTGIGGGNDVDIGTIAVNISPVNDAPTLSGMPASFTFTEDVAQTGNISGLVIADVDAGSADVTLTFELTGGTLTFEPNSGISINGNMLTGSIADLNAYLDTGAGSTGNVTYTPDLNNTDPVTIRATVNDLGNSGSGGELTATSTSIIKFIPVNDAPVLTATGGTTDYTEDDPATVIATTISIDDPDLGDVISEATVSITRNFEAGDILGFVNTGTITSSYDAATGILTLSGNDTAANYETALESITFSSTSQNPSEQPRTISFQVADGDGEISNVEVGASVAPDAVNDAPVIATLDEFDVVEDQGGELVFSGTPISDVDAEDGIVLLTITVDNGSLDFPPGTGITISGHTLTGTIADINQYLVHGGTNGDSIAFTPILGDSNPVILTLTINDQGNSGGGPALSDTANTVINIDSENDAPILTATGGTTSYTEGDAATLIATSITIDDPDAGDVISEATVSISSNFEAGDILDFVDTATIAGTYDAVTGVLTLRGNDSAANYEAALQSITFFSPSENPSEQPRTISFQVADGVGELSNIAAGANVQPDAVNDAPVIATLDEFAVTEDQGGELNFSAAPISDVDAGNGEVTLTFSVDNGSLGFPPGTGITISGNMLTGTIADINEYLVNGGIGRAMITYTPEPNDTNPATLTLTVNDQGNSGGPALTDTVNTTINITPVNDAPVLTATGGTTDYTEGDAATLIATSITIDDPDAGDVISEATVSISSNFEAGDILDFVDTATIAGTYDAVTGVLTLRGNDSAANYEAALQSITFFSPSENPSEQPRTISFQVADGVGELSNIAAGANVQPDAVNDAPVIATLGEFDVTEDQPGELTFSGTPISDVDAGNGAVTLTFSVDNGSLGFPPGTGITISGNTLTGTIADINEYLVNGGIGRAMITYTPEPNDTNPATLTLTVNDQGNSGGPALTDTVNTTINITPENDAPILTATGGTTDYTEGDAATLIATSITIDDPDAGDVISEATVSISSNFEAGDILDFVDTATIAGTYDAVTGVLTLRGNDSAANYEAALQSITFFSPSENPSEQPRTISFQVADGVGELSNIAAGANVQPDAVNDAPVIATLGEFDVTEDQPGELTFSGTPISDVDAGNGAVTLTFSVGSGSLDFPAGTGITISGNTLTGTIADINQYLVHGGTSGDAIIYTPASNDTNPATLTLTVNDQGNSGGPALTDTVNTTINITPENDAPILTATGGTTDYTEGDAATLIATSVSIDDPDLGDTVSGATVSISSNFEVGDILGFVNTGTITGTYDAATGILTLSGDDSATAYEAALESITFFNPSENPSEQTRTISYQVADGDGAVSDTEVGASVQPDAINDAPVIATLGEFDVTEDQPGELTFSGTPISDVDAGNGAVTLTFSVGSGSLDFPAGTGITISGNTLTGTIADINQYLVHGGTSGDAIIYTPASNDTDPVTLTLTVNDQGNSGGPALTDSANTTINIAPENDAPILTATGGTTDYTEGDPATVIATSVSIDDPDLGDTVSGATVSISSNFEVGDILGFVNTGTITGTYDAATGILTLSGDDSATAYEAALESITFFNPSENPSEQTRTISYQVADGDGAVSDIEVGASVQPDAINDAPVIATLGEFDVTEDQPGELTFSGTPISDVDAGNGAVTLTFSVGSGSLDFPAGTGITISGNTLTGTIADINQYLVHGGTSGDAIIYTPASNDTEPVTLTLTVNDQGNSGGPALTDSANTTINITPENDAPILTATGGTTDYTEGDPATVIATSVSIDDPDLGDTVSGATVSISSNFEVGDILGFVNTGTITGTYDAATGILTLSGDDSATAYEAALESITFFNPSENPSEQTRTISYQVADGDGAVSDIEVGASVQPDAINDAPFIDELPDFDVREDEPTGIIFNSNTISDIDAGDGEVTLTITVDNGSLDFPLGVGIGITISGNTLTGTIDNINQYLMGGGDAGNFITYTPEPDDTNTATLTMTVNDQGNSGGPAQTTTQETAILIISLNDAPELTISSPTQSYTEDDSPVLIDSGLEVFDVDDINLESAEVTIASGLEDPTDLLTFTATGNITGSYDATTGVLTLTGSDTLANYQTVLRSVKFSTSSDDPSEDDRVIEFVVNDGDDVSNIGTVTVSVAGSDDPLSINLDSIAASPEIVINGGFEAGTDFTSGGSILSSGSTDITNWTVTDDDVHYIQDPSGNSVGEGERGVNLNGDEPGAISTTLTTVIGQTYEVSFQGRSDGTLEVLATGGTVGSYATSSDANGLYESYTFTATAALTTLTFTSTSPGAFGSSLDDVTMREVVGATVDAVEDTPIEISDIQIIDPDADFGDVHTVTLSSKYGLITVNSDVVNGLDISAIDDNGTYTVTLTGTLFQINETLAVADGVIYTPNLDFNGVDTIDVVANGPGGGSTPVEIASDTITINVQAVDDAPPINSEIGDVVEGDISNLTGIQFIGDTRDAIGYGVSTVGDINNDGIDDFAVGSLAVSGDSGTPVLSGSVYVIYGAAGANPYVSLANAEGEIALDAMAANGRGFELVGVATDDRAGFSVSGGGDLNNDGISDIVIGAQFVDSPLNSGAAYVIYGGQDFGTLTDSTTGEISLDTLGVIGRGGLDGFEINHFDSNAVLGYDVNLTGDVNNDGIADLIVSSLDQTRLDFSGAWVVCGGQDFDAQVDPSTGAFDVASIGNGIDGFLLQGEVFGDAAGVSVDVVSDFNRDGVDDILIGARGHDGGGVDLGVSYLIYGGQAWANLTGGGSTDPTISLGDIGTGIGDLRGFRIEGGEDRAFMGTLVSNAGDVNGDGIGDLLVTSTGNSSTLTTASTYLIYGGQNLSGTISANQIGSGVTGSVNGAVFVERSEGELITHATALGDIDGDGYSDILIGSSQVIDSSGGQTGRAYIIYGSSTPGNGTHSLADVGTAIDGFQLIGENPSDLFGQRAQMVGDVNSDGYNDFIVTAVSNDDGGSNAGAAYLVYGSDYDNRVNQVSGAEEENGGVFRQIIHGTPGDDVINGGGGGDIITTGAGDDIITIGNAFIDFIDAGSGTDTLKFGDAGSFDLTNINDLRLQSIEALDTTNGLVNDVTLSITDIFQISDDAHAGLETLLDAVLPTSFVIDADANDTYTFENGSAGGIWTLSTSLSAFTPDHNVYKYVDGGSGDVLATLAIDDEVTPTIV